jgi:hypothetical protein
MADGVALMDGITSSGWTDFLLAIKKATADLGNPEVLWYRGHANAEFYLLASLLRYENGIEKEKHLFTNFKKFSDRILKRRDSEWETLFEMQHYGIPTRLLDWTETFGVALFFATNYNLSRHRGKDAAIYVLDPLNLNKLSGIGEILRIPQDESKFGYTKIYWEHTPFAASGPIAIEPIFINDRMLAQRGMFTVHHDRIEPIEDKFPTAIKKVVLPSSAMVAAAEFLELSNLNIFSIYPDFAGISEYLSSTSGLKPRC